MADELDPQELILSQEEKSLLDEYGRNPLQLGQTAAALFEASLYEKAFKIQSILVKAFPQDEHGWVACGISLMYIDVAAWKETYGLPPYQNAERAIHYFDEALKINRNNALAWYHKAHCLAQIGYLTLNKYKLKEGLKCYDEYLRFRPDDAKCRFEKAHFQEIFRDMIKTFGET